MAWTTPKTNFNAGDVLTAAEMNAIGSNLAALGEAWTTFTPSFTNLTVGNGTADAAYLATAGLNVVRVQVVFGSTSTMGTDPTLTLPGSSQLVSAQALTGVPLGTAHALDAGTSIFAGYVQAASSTTVRIRFISTSGATAAATVTPNATSPMTWTTSDRLDLLFMYEAA